MIREIASDAPERTDQAVTDPKLLHGNGFRIHNPIIKRANCFRYQACNLPERSRISASAECAADCPDPENRSAPRRFDEAMGPAAGAIAQITTDYGLMLETKTRIGAKRFIE
ncbi:hypothetical protein [Mycobacterium sp. UM_CSW]|uniref:hypothetical protein n=1 Tax=Mycobacterium sp. UM_CSW TaxID=1370119 RepID=UPI00126881CE|nr:hypothetical protein [Mycobacterium sp. UM_CSW]